MFDEDNTSDTRLNQRIAMSRVKKRSTSNGMGVIKKDPPKGFVRDADGYLT